MAERDTVLVTSRSFGSGDRDVERELVDAGLRPRRGSVVHDVDDLAPLLADAVAWIAGTAPVGDEHLALAPRLRVVARYGVGTDSVDLTAAARRNIVVTNTPAANSTAVADLAVALLLAVLRGLIPNAAAVRRGRWDVHRGREVGALAVGLVGLGRTGAATAARLRGFGATVLGHDPYVTGPVEHVRTVDGLDELLGAVDVLSLHCPGGTLVVDDALLARTKRGLVLVNTARAELVDEHVLAKALRDGRLAGYAADTVAGEAAAYDSPLFDDDLADRVVITSHLGAQTVDAVDRMGTGAVQAVLDVLAGRTPLTAVARDRGSP